MARIRVCGIVGIIISSFVLLQCVTSAVESGDSPWYKDLCRWDLKQINKHS